MEKLLLSDAVPGTAYRIREIRDGARLVSRLSAMGLRVGSPVTICQNQKKQPVLLFARDTLIAIGREESKKIVVGGADDE